ncbi:MAG: flavin reductase family protein [Prevotellaceae bacterium]|nr:flavin reductase family protein [Prevotellaceae bacterium]
MNVFTQIDSKEIPDNVVHLMADDWMLITAGTSEHFNTMTASWGAIGHLWNRPVAFCFIRPQRYTFEFAEAQDYFTLSFFDETYRSALALCGRVSGRDVDKVKEAGLTPRILESGNVAFEEARLIIECRKIYTDFFSPEQFIDNAADIYPAGDFHKMYIGEIVNVWLMVND